MDTNTTADRFVRSMLPGSYISTDGRLNASLKSAGYCGTCGCKCVRHYHITYVHSTATIGTACTLKQAADRYLGWNR